jgi:protein-tyrosine phosphatase
VIAHIHRYCGIYSKDAMAQLLQADAIFQINNEAFGSFRACRFVKRLLRNGYPVLFGSDTHNLDSRKPNFDLLLKKTKPEWRENAERIFYEHTKRT